ncbi:uncharacterized protein MELLADRAFT_90901 [Melampsora larici-populina 98AG31]|uniref:Uncharacterized protein n=1 Tax=Melampsora larici-populina (strain 98AG31 / pathotype 3-4-7) TaxID=747676 RepID=F4R7Z0_MELLP|nr:uncharacterized protein MELLADRAFT_90901 [Melampsora larici-populina 98AG31]EGG11704.1 hypothetical protein MELLADRAFT_90901 [Melampsora larici-populina 98AG31]
MLPKTKGPSTIQALMARCPANTPTSQCTRCQFEPINGDKLFYCHCGARGIKMSQGRTEPVNDHWKSDKCITITNAPKNTRPLTDFFKKRPAEDAVPTANPCPKPKSQIQGVPCAGMNDDTWVRPDTDFLIIDCILGSPSEYHGSRPRWVVCEELFKTREESKLTTKQVTQLQSVLQAEATWRIDRKGDPRFWSTLGTHGSAGLFKNMDVFEGLVKAVASRATREKDGKSLRGLRVQQPWDDFTMTLWAISPAAGRFVRANLHSRDARSLRETQRLSGMQLADGLDLSNFVRISEQIKKLGYNGPLALGSDQTVCVKTLRVYNGCIVGAQGGDVAFSGAKDLQAKVKSILENDSLCTKVRAYTIQVPLPNVPTFVVAMLASYNNEKSEDILTLHDTAISLAQKAGLNILSIGSDGAANELSAQAMLANLANETLSFSFVGLGVKIHVPLIGQPPRQIVAVQDPKHARKTAANQILSGARCLAFGRFYFGIGQLTEILTSENSPLYQHDVHNSDKQDDGRAYRTFSSETVKAALNLSDGTGLAVYLFVCGKLCDAWLNRHMGHSERVRSAWTAAFFLRKWNSYLQKRKQETGSMMSPEKNGISPQSLKIFTQLAESLIALIISHREYYPEFPLLPWKHGTEMCEHLFGLLRIISPNFTVLDARQLVPKLFAIIKGIMTGTFKVPSSEHIHAGYKHCFEDEGDKPTGDLGYFPSDHELREDLSVAEQRATHLARLCGMDVPTDAIDDSVDLPTDLEIFDNDTQPDPSQTEGISECTICDISESRSRDIEVVYRFDPSETDESEVFETAAAMMGERQKLDVQLTEIDENAVVETHLNRARLTLSDLLNTPSTDALCRLTNSTGTALNISSIVEIRQKHDSEVKKKHGNERKRKHLNDVIGSVSSTDTLSPSECSKLVAVLVKDSNTATDSSISRMHRWNIHVKLSLADVQRNTTTSRDMSWLVGNGVISVTNPIKPMKFFLAICNNKLYIGKVLAVYEYINDKHRWVASATKRDKLSYISAQLYSHQPDMPIAMSYVSGKPHEYMFAHLEASKIHYLFPETRGSNLDEPRSGMVLLPESISQMVDAMASSDYNIKTFNCNLASQRSKKK